MRHLAGVVGLESVDQLPVLAENANKAIARPQEYVVRPGANARDVIVLEEVGGLAVRERHLGDVEEVKRLPLCRG